jgi:hypothetical protein
VAFNYGFNVSNIQKFSVRFLRAEVVEPVRYRVRDLRRRPLPRLSRAERWLRGVTLDVVSKLPPDWDDFYGRCARHYRFLVRRDSEYVGWRYFRSPGRYEVVTIRKWGVLAGWFVFRVRDDVMRIGDMLLDPDLADVFEYGLRHLSAVLPVNVIETWCPPRPRWLSNLLTELAFDDRPEPQDLSVMCVPFTRPDAAQLLRSELFYTMGDSDLF